MGSPHSHSLTGFFSYKKCRPWVIRALFNDLQQHLITSVRVQASLVRDFAQKRRRGMTNRAGRRVVFAIWAPQSQVSPLPGCPLWPLASRPSVGLFHVVARHPPLVLGVDVRVCSTFTSEQSRQVNGDRRQKGKGRASTASHRKKKWHLTFPGGPLMCFSTQANVAPTL